MQLDLVLNLVSNNCRTIKKPLPGKLPSTDICPFYLQEPAHGSVLTLRAYQSWLNFFTAAVDSSYWNPTGTAHSRHLWNPKKRSAPPPCFLRLVMVACAAHTEQAFSSGGFLWTIMFILLMENSAEETRPPRPPTRCNITRGKGNS